jgi:hypothetical protein
MRDWLTIELVLGTLLVTSYTCVGLLALWAAMSRWHWFLRTAVVLAVLSPLLAVPAYEPFVAFVLQAVVVVVGVQLARWWRRRRADNSAQTLFQTVKSARLPTVRFSLTTLLLATVLVAVAAYVATHLPRLNVAAWTTVVLNGLASGCAVLLGAWMFTSRRKLVAWPVAVVACFGLSAVMAWQDRFSISLLLGEWPPRPPTSGNMALQVLNLINQARERTFRIWCVTSLAVALAACVVPFLWTAGFALRRRTARWAVRGTFVVVAGALSLFPAIVLWQLLNPLPVPHVTLPNPNGYDDLVAAGNMINTTNSPILSTLVEPSSTDQLAAEVAKFSAVYDRIRLGLSRPIRVPVWSEDGKPLATRDTDFSGIQGVRGVARALSREAELAQQQGRYRDAAEISLENVRIGGLLTRETAVLHYLVGIAIEGIGDWTLYPAIAQLDADTCRELIATLVEVERNREPLADVLYRDRVWYENARGWHGHLSTLLYEIVEGDRTQSAMARTLARKQAITRLLIVELALRAYELEHSALPDRLDQLVTDYLAGVPVDPFATDGSPLRYAVTPEGHVAYTVGYDGDDDGGRPSSRDAGWMDDGDIRLDAYFAPQEEPAAADEKEAAEFDDDSD